jgi:hypothetical protein
MSGVKTHAKLGRPMGQHRVVVAQGGDIKRS